MKIPQVLRSKEICRLVEKIAQDLLWRAKIILLWILILISYLAFETKNYM